MIEYKNYRRKLFVLSFSILATFMLTFDCHSCKNTKIKVEEKNNIGTKHIFSWIRENKEQSFFISISAALGMIGCSYFFAGTEKKICHNFVKDCEYFKSYFDKYLSRQDRIKFIREFIEKIENYVEKVKKIKCKNLRYKKSYMIEALESILKSCNSALNNIEKINRSDDILRKIEIDDFITLFDKKFGLAELISNYLRVKEMYTKKECINDLEEQIETLAKLNKEVNVKDEEIKGLFALAVTNGHTKIVKILLDNGAEVDAPDPKDKGKYTPLMLSIIEYNFEMIELLLSKGAKLDKTNNNGRTALDIATELYNSYNTDNYRKIKELLESQT
ncbi:MAG: ankyrin repeat domain-containing protein [Firmicutes bacterium]|nr:ankyrin repeat domain-containing protein [Bacillota bacterium]